MRRTWLGRVDGRLPRARRRARAGRRHARRSPAIEPRRLSRAAQRFFDDVARRYDRSFAPDARATAADLASITDALCPSSLVLDLGCGTGRAFPHLLAAGACVIGLDASAPMLAQARKRRSTEQVTLVRADLYGRWPIAAGSIDAVIALHSVLAHPPGLSREAWAHVGREILRVARPGALVAIDLPEPAWARAHLRPLAPDRFLYGAPDAADPNAPSIEAVIPEPATVIEALCLPLTCAPCATGVRAMGRVSLGA